MNFNAEVVSDKNFKIIGHTSLKIILWNQFTCIGIDLRIILKARIVCTDEVIRNQSVEEERTVN